MMAEQAKACLHVERACDKVIVVLNNGKHHSTV
jgi:hypothetical protein